MKSIFLISILVIAFQHIHAQDNNTMQLAFSGGVTNTTINGPIVDHYDKRPTGELKRRQGYTFSSSLRYNFSPLLFMEVGLGYYQKGGYFFGSGYVDDIVMPVDYLNIPVIAGFRPINKGVINLSGELGLSYDVRVGCNEPGCLNLDDTFQCCGPPPTTKDETGVLFDINNPVAIVYGASMDINFSKSFQASGRFRQFDDVRYFFGNVKDFSISGKGYSVELSTRFRIK